MNVEHITLPPPAPGTRRSLQVLRFGAPAARPKAYLQAALHGGEIPGMLVQQRLAGLLHAAEQRGELRGQVVLVPVANPIGSSQHLLGELLGRYELAGGVNFNRGFPELHEAVAARVGAALGADAERNVALIRDAALAELGDPPDDEAGFLKHTLLRLAVDADLVLDLHCDLEAVLHLYTGTALWPAAAELAAQLGARVTLLASRSGGNPFDEACAALWWRLAERFPQSPVPAACLAATVELRGNREVSEALAAGDADNLLRALQRRGVLAGEPGPLPPAVGDARPLEGVAEVRAPRAGVVSYAAEPGATVAAGQPLAVLIDPLDIDPDSARTPVPSPIDGVLFARRADRLARPGQILCRVAGTEPLPERLGKHLLGD